MFQKPPTTPNTNAITSNVSSNEPPKKELIPEVVPVIRALPEAMSEFIQDVFRAKLNKPPYIEADRTVIEHYNPAHMIQGFEDVGYFIYDGIVVYERGKVPEEVKNKGKKK